MSSYPDYHRDQLRWAWRKFMLDRQKPAAWDAKARAILIDLSERGEYDPDMLAHATGHEPHVLVVERAAGAFSWRSRISRHQVEEALAAPAKARATVVKRGLDVSDQGFGSSKNTAVARRAIRHARRQPADQHALDILLRRHGRDLAQLLRELPETAWLPLLRAYDVYTSSPTAESHRRWRVLATSDATGSRADLDNLTRG